MRPIVSRSAGKDSLKVLRIPLRFHQSFAATIGTAVEIAQRSVAAIERVDNCFGLNARLMYCPIAEINELLGMTDGPGCARAALVAVIGRSGRITSSQRIDHTAISNASGPAAVSYLLILAVPAGNGEPYGGLNLGIVTGVNRQFNLAVRRYCRRGICRSIYCCARGARPGKRPCGDRRCRRDCRPGELQGGEAFTRLLSQTPRR